MIGVDLLCHGSVMTKGVSGARLSTPRPRSAYLGKLASTFHIYPTRVAKLGLRPLGCGSRKTFLDQNRTTFSTSSRRIVSWQGLIFWTYLAFSNQLQILPHPLAVLRDRRHGMSLQGSAIRGCSNSILSRGPIVRGDVVLNKKRICQFSFPLFSCTWLCRSC